MRHCKAVLSLAFCALLLLAPGRAYAAGYEEVAAEIPFSVRSDAASGGWAAAIEPVDGAPAPAQTRAETESGGEGRFVLRFSRPGTYRYRIYQTETGESGVVYDDRVYTVTVAVRNGAAGGLACSVWATLDGGKKLDAIEFINHDRETPPEETPTAVGDKPKTGDDGRPALYLAIMALSALTLSLAVIERKRREKEGAGL